ncbi:MAG: S8 family peptidase, partial [Candidatus Sericytochromatia bacterium]|nr:S8 family peptidase [Candidatus Sericytochromatia bacterium]
AAAPSSPFGPLGAKAQPEALMVKLARPVSAARLRARLAAGNPATESSLDRALARIDWARVPSQGDGFRAALLAEPGVVAVLPSRTLRALGTAGRRVGSAPYNDPQASVQYALARVDTPGAHAVTTGSARTTLAIVDTGVDYRHPDFREATGAATRVVKGEDYVNLDGDPMDRNGHGTHCAGIAAATANNGVGIVGQAPGVRLLAERVLGDNGAGSDAAVAAGIIHATDQGASVISLSLGGPEAVPVIDDAVRYAQARGVLLVAAMGNEGGLRPSYPAANAGVLAVGATDAADAVCGFSNRGAWISLCAPGDAILSTLPGPAGYGLKSGTSMATPCVAGVAALLRDRHPDWSPAQVRARLEATSDDLGAPGFDPIFGHGRLNAGRALRG